MDIEQRPVRVEHDTAQACHRTLLKQI
jgi:hypothetical protein